MRRVDCGVMTRLGRYLLREVAGLYLVGVAGLCLLLSIDLLSVLARFLLEQNASLATVGRLLLYKLPWFLHLTLPIGVIFALLVAIGRWVRDAELKAAFAGAVAPRQLLAPLIAFGALVSVLSVGVNGFLEPWGEAAYEREIQSFIFARPPTASQLDAAFFIDGVGTFYAGRVRAEREDPSRAELSGVLVLTADGRTVTAPSGTWDSEARLWRLERARVTAAAESSSAEVGALSLPFPLEASAAQTLTRPAQQTLAELQLVVRELSAAGADRGRALFELHRRLADASAGVLFALAAGALALRMRGRGAALAWTIALVVAFWAAWTLTGTLYDRGVLEPLTAAWATPLLVGLAGLGLLVWVRRA